MADQSWSQQQLAVSGCTLPSLWSLEVNCTVLNYIIRFGSQAQELLIYSLDERSQVTYIVANKAADGQHVNFFHKLVSTPSKSFQQQNLCIIGTLTIIAVCLICLHIFRTRLYVSKIFISAKSSYLNQVSSLLYLELAISCIRIFSSFCSTLRFT